jgi:hypothetical protein
MMDAGLRHEGRSRSSEVRQIGDETFGELYRTAQRDEVSAGTSSGMTPSRSLAIRWEVAGRCGFATEFAYRSDPWP